VTVQQERPGYPVPVLAAAILAAEGVSFLLVGSAALWLHGEPIPVADADVVIEPAAACAGVFICGATCPAGRQFTGRRASGRSAEPSPYRCVLKKPAILATVGSTYSGLS
jgi:hypothetical protein